MSVTRKDVEHIAKLAKLKFDDSEIEKLTSEMNNILLYMEKLNEVDTSSVEPLSHPVEMNNVFREDIKGKSLSAEEALKNAPSKDDKYFHVPKVIG
ncbi:MAG: Asp-tRNA(Asn)/Glu-tRNA(Gln) amidotransferase subunit GatC [Ignavibacteriales bacterium]|nr:MAG: Asp-tRNA(Asn)/Glu-tRNA(Gln) amidotransferase subunit GatC [Ignavibacteriales bacterium]